MNLEWRLWKDDDNGDYNSNNGNDNNNKACWFD